VARRNLHPLARGSESEKGSGKKDLTKGGEEASGKEKPRTGKYHKMHSLGSE